MRVEIAPDGSGHRRRHPQQPAEEYGQIVAPVATAAALKHWRRTVKSRPTPSRDDRRLFTKAAKEAVRDLLGREFGEEEGILEKEQKLVSMAKKIGLLAAGAATQKYMEKLAGQQELVALISDIIIEVFAMESAVLRTLKKVQKEGEEKSRTQIAVTQVYVNDAFAGIEWMGKQIFAAIAEGEELRTQLMALKRLAKNTPVNTIALRREIADSVIPLGQYHLTKL